MKVRLTESQTEVVNHNDGALLVVAGPGSGKTRVLAERIRRLLAEPSEHFRVLALTFTNKAANEMIERLADVPNINERAFIGTMHSFCMEVLANRGKAVGIDGLPHVFESYSDRKQILQQAVSSDPELQQALLAAGDTKMQSHRLDTWLREISDAKNDLLLPEMVVDEGTRRLYELYDTSMRACRAVDFDDLLLLTYRLFEERPAIAAFYRRQYRYVVIDEAQDLNEAQYRVLCALCGKEYTNVMLVGDPKQAIFMWNGAHPKYLDLFVKDFSATTIELQENFRSASRVIDAAKALNSQYSVGGAFPVRGVVEIRECATVDDEAEFVIRRITELIDQGHPDIEGKLAPESFAVLGRNKFVLAKIEEGLEREQIAFYKKVSAGSVESASDLVAEFELALRVLANPLDRLHVGMLAQRWSSGKTADDIYQNADLRSLTGLDVIQLLGEKATGGAYKSVLESIAELDWTPEDIKLMRSLDVLGRVAAELDDNTRMLVEKDLQEWKKHWNYYVRTEPGGLHSAASFLSQVALGTTQQAKQEGVALLTVHSAKGMEFDVVFMVGMNQGTFPDYRARGAALEEERRNAFVAVTRSRRLLFLTYPKVRLMPWGDMKYQAPSEFVNEIKAKTRQN